MKKTFKVTGMHCRSCEMLLKEALEETNGVKSAEASHKDSNLTVNFDETKISEGKIKAIIRETGYAVE